MKTQVIVAHPNPDSFNHAIAETVTRTLIENNRDVIYHDLYEESFDPILPFREIPRNGDVDETVLDYCRDLKESDLIVIIHPNWWGQPPAILTGWIDRVIRPGVAYEFLENDSGDGVPRGLLKASCVVVINTSNTYPEREKEVFGDPLETIWKNCIFGLCGITDFHRVIYTPVVISTESQRKNWLEETVQLIKRVI